MRSGVSHPPPATAAAGAGPGGEPLVLRCSPPVAGTLYSACRRRGNPDEAIQAGGPQGPHEANAGEHLLQGPPHGRRQSEGTGWVKEKVPKAQGRRDGKEVVEGEKGPRQPTRSLLLGQVGRDADGSPGFCIDHLDGSSWPIPRWCGCDSNLRGPASRSLRVRPWLPPCRLPPSCMAAAPSVGGPRIRLVAFPDSSYLPSRMMAHPPIPGQRA